MVESKQKGKQKRRLSPNNNKENNKKIKKETHSNMTTPVSPQPSNDFEIKIIPENLSMPENILPQSSSASINKEADNIIVKYSRPVENDNDPRQYITKISKELKDNNDVEGFTLIVNENINAIFSYISENIAEGVELLRSILYDFSTDYIYPSVAVVYNLTEYATGIIFDVGSFLFKSWLSGALLATFVRSFPLLIVNSGVTGGIFNVVGFGLEWIVETITNKFNIFTLEPALMTGILTSGGFVLNEIIPPLSIPAATTTYMLRSILGLPSTVTKSIFSSLSTRTNDKLGLTVYLSGLLTSSLSIWAVSLFALKRTNISKDDSFIKTYQNISNSANYHDNFLKTFLSITETAAQSLGVYKDNQIQFGIFSSIIKELMNALFGGSTVNVNVEATNIIKNIFVSIFTLFGFGAVNLQDTFAYKSGKTSKIFWENLFNKLSENQKLNLVKILKEHYIKETTLIEDSWFNIFIKYLPFNNTYSGEFRGRNSHPRFKYSGFAYETHMGHIWDLFGQLSPFAKFKIIYNLIYDIVYGICMKKLEPVWNNLTSIIVTMVLVGCAYYFYQAKIEKYTFNRDNYLEFINSIVNVGIISEKIILSQKFDDNEISQLINKSTLNKNQKQKLFNSLRTKTFLTEFQKLLDTTRSNGILLKNSKPKKQGKDTDLKEQFQSDIIQRIPEALERLNMTDTQFKALVQSINSKNSNEILKKAKNTIEQTQALNSIEYNVSPIMNGIEYNVSPIIEEPNDVISVPAITYETYHFD